MAKLTKPEDRVTKAHIKIMTSPEFCMFSGVLSVGKVTYTDEIPTACTNGCDVFYNPEFLKTLTDKELAFLILHENMHKVYQQLTMWQKLFKEDAQLANMSADYVVNSAILEADPNGNRASMPSHALYDKKYRDMTTKQIFEALKDDKKNGNLPNLGKGDNMGEGETMDSHDWEGAEEMSKEETKKVQKQIEQALRQGEILRGKLKGNRHRGVDKLLEPKVNWREELREFITSVSRSKDETSFKRPHRRFIGQDIYMPSMIGHSMDKLIVAGDLSGSIDKDTERMFLTELIQICKDLNPKTLDLIWWDSAVQGHEIYREGEYDTILARTKPSGGGGTTVGCVNKFIKDNYLEPDVVVIFTDGYVENDWGGAWSYPTLWAITEEDLVSPHGKSIHVNDD
tara:strand:- start:517 stop:1710 length:1194 start_codon:yes stop_codon:yes gene_type:complete